MDFSLSAGSFSCWLWAAKWLNILARRGEACHIKQRQLPRVRILDANVLTEVLRPDIFIKVYYDIFTGNAIHHVVSKTNPHRIVVGCEANTDQVVIIVGLIWVANVMDVQDQ